MVIFNSQIWVAILALFFLLNLSSIVSGDVEPNDTRETAENINLGQVILGSLDASLDIHDFHNITLEKGIDIVAILEGPRDADFDLGIYDSEGLLVAGAGSDSDSQEVVVYTPPGNGTYIVDVYARFGAGSYSLEIKEPKTASNTTYELTEAVSQGHIKVAFNGVYFGPSESFNLETGEDVFFGRCVDIEISSVVTNDLDIIVPPGLILVADNEAVESKVVTGRETIHAESVSKTTRRLYAMSVNMKKNVPDFSTSFHLGEMAEGELVKVVEVLNATGTQKAPGQIAVWMVTDSVQRKELEQLGASDSDIKDAVDILDSARVDPPFSDDEPDSGFLTCVGLVALVVVLIAVIAFISSRSKGQSQDSIMKDEAYLEEKEAEEGK